MPALLKAAPARLLFPTIEKPPGPWQIDWSHALAQSLAVCVVHSDIAPGVDLDLVRGGYGNGSSGFQDTAFGGGTRFNISNGVSVTLPAHELSTSTGSGTGDLTVAIQMRWNASPDWNSIVGIADTGSSHFFKILSDSTSGANLILDTSYNYTEASFSATVGRFYAIVMVRSGSTASLYVDGVVVASQTDTGAVWSSSSVFGWGDIAAGAPNRTVDFTAVQTAAWNRALDPSSILQWSQDPFCFLAPPEGEMPAFFAGGAPPASGVIFRRTRSHLGTKVNSRQVA